jgi:hypothetical protein
VSFELGKNDKSPIKWRVAFAQKESLKTELVGLSVECPFDGTNPQTCPLHKIRKKSLRERCEWAEKLSKTDALKLLTFHHECLREKQSSKAKAGGRYRE